MTTRPRATPFVGPLGALPRYRLRAGLRQEALADQAGLSAAAIGALDVGCGAGMAAQIGMACRHARQTGDFRQGDLEEVRDTP
ncbi:MAG: hypothetical protein JO057_04340 [Chloroflexi bacterium]|nr:hypothetical protein [Chloroflexota bacterium]